MQYRRRQPNRYWQNEDATECDILCSYESQCPVPPITLDVRRGRAAIAIIHMSPIEAERLHAELTAVLAKAHRGTGKEGT